MERADCNRDGPPPGTVGSSAPAGSVRQGRTFASGKSFSAIPDRFESLHLVC
jgi:hypothetical protein